MIKHLSFILLLTICVSGCVKNDLEEKTLQPVSGRVFTASFESENARTYVEEGNLLRWNAGDQISLFDSNTLNRQYQFDGETGDNAGTFSIVNAPFGTGNDLNCHYALYPYASNVKITENGVITATLPAVQSYAENSFGLDANTMVAVTENHNDTFLKFKNVGGYLKLQLYGDDVTVKSIELTGNSNEKIAGKASITPTYNDDPQISMLGDATSCITLNCGEGVKIGSTAENITDFWIVIPPTTFEDGFTITITDINDETFIKSTSNEIAIERNVIKPMKAFEVIFENESEDEGSSNDYIDEYGVNHGPGVEIDGVVWAPVNCGYHAEDFKYGKLYQWGRKYGQGYWQSYGTTTYDATKPTIIEGPVSLTNGQSKENSNIFYTSKGNWVDLANNTLWNVGDEYSPIKGEYDPCPDGWRVPTKLELNKLKDGNESAWVELNEQKGRWFSGSNSCTQNITVDIFLAGAGYLRYDGEGYYRSASTGHGTYWSSFTDGEKGYYLYFSYQYASIISEDVLAYGRSVRCVQE